MKKLTALTTLMAATVLAAGCTTTARVGEFTVVSTKNMDVESNTFTIGKDRVKGQDKRTTYFGFGGGNAVNMKTAVDKAVETTPGAVGLSDAVITQGHSNILFVDSFWWEVEGSPILKNKK